MEQLFQGKVGSIMSINLFSYSYLDITLYKWEANFCMVYKL